ncbi:MAG: IS1634 family transposase [Planctomycetaceae bacterium]|jgi:transposase|nr:IS1634 family transposase [Planctomycetaceae bacterium]
MYVEKSVHTDKKGIIHTQYFLRQSRREGKKIIKTTLLNITGWGEKTCEAFAAVLKNKRLLPQLAANLARPQHPETASTSTDLSYKKTPEITQGKSVGAVWLLYSLAKQIGLVDTLGSSRDGRLALWQILARTIDQGSSLSATRLARNHEIDFLELGTFDENSLYNNLDWLAKHQSEIETKLHHKHYHQSPCSLFLYDVTSSYFEGVQNELAAFGYNRDKKKGKMQIVIGLLCADDGVPVAVELFEGNTNDTKTMHNQIKKTSQRFHAQKVVFLGDRGMIKSTQQKELLEHDFDFITALTQKQIKTLLKQNVFQLSLFDEELHEVVTEQNRYILKRNPIRADEINQNCQSKILKLEQIITERNRYLSQHSRAKLSTSLKYCNDKLRRMNIQGWNQLESNDTLRTISIVTDKEKLWAISQLDSCYCLTTSLAVNEYDKKFVHSRYKDLAMVEKAFRTCKTWQLELRPIYVRKESRTRGHVFVEMLSYMLIQKLRESWGKLDMTVEEGIELLETLCTVEVQLNGNIPALYVPKPRKEIEQLFTLTEIPIPEIFPTKLKTEPNSKTKIKSVANKQKTKK